MLCVRKLVQTVQRTVADGANQRYVVTVSNRGPDIKLWHFWYSSISVLTIFPCYNKVLRMCHYFQSVKREIFSSFDCTYYQTLWIHNRYKSRISIWAQLKYPGLKPWHTVWDQAETVHHGLSRSRFETGTTVENVVLNILNFSICIQCPLFMLF